MKALVTGAAGFVGRHACKRLEEKGYKIVGIDNLISESSLHPNEWPEHLKCKDISFIQKDCRDFFQYYTEEQHTFDVVVHLAAVVGGRATIENAPLAVAEDLAIDAMMFNWATKTKPKKILYFSSSAAYPIKFQQGDENDRKLSEDLISFDFDIGMADMTYGWTKLTGEYLAQLAHEKYDLDVVCFRPFSGYGEDQHETYPFPAIMNRAINKEDPLTIWSDTTRDFIYIEDCLDAMFYFMDKINDGSGVNLGTSVGTSFKQLARLAANKVGYNPTIKVLNDMPKGVQYRVADTTFTKKLGFTPKTSLNEGIRTFLKHNNGEKND